MFKRRLQLISAVLCLMASSVPSFAETAADYLVTELPGLPEGTNITQHAGHIEIDASSNANMFFWLIHNQKSGSTDKLMIWLNGGPGCSSMDGLFLELGPYRVNKDLSLKINEAGWQEYTNIIYVDQPLGTGFSFAETNSYDRNITQIAATFITFVDKFFEIFPEFKVSDLYLAGESYAVVMYNLKGLAIGNGWVADKEQYDAYYDFGVAQGLLTGNYLDRAAQQLNECHTEILKDGPRIKHAKCETILQTIIDQSTYQENGKLFCMNQYDIRIKNETHSSGCGMGWPRELPEVTAYLGLPEVIKAIHAQKQQIGWIECAGGVSFALQDDDSKPSIELLPGILEEIPILLFSGDQDLICNHLGTEYFIGNLTWNGAKGFQDAQPVEWRIDDMLAGYYTTARNLTYVLIRDASHMVPYNRPLETLDMINRFLGVSGGKVKGKSSWVGEKPIFDEISTVTATSTTKTTSIFAGDAPPTSKPEKEIEKKPWEEYYEWGTATLIFVIFFAGGLGYFAYRSRRRAHLGSGRSNGLGIGETLANGLLRLRRGVGRGRGLAVKLSNDGEETNELDELVIESPTLFSAEDVSGDDEDHDRPRRSRFSIADDEDVFDDFQGVETERR